MKRRDFLASSVGAGVVLAGCSGGDGQGTDVPRVSVTDMGYDPRILEVDAGATVTWANEDRTAVPHHTVTSKSIVDDAAAWSFDEKLTEEGQEVTHTFEDAGLYTYVGTIRGEECMCGLVAVGEEYNQPLPCSPMQGGGCQ